MYYELIIYNVIKEIFSDIQQLSVDAKYGLHSKMYEVEKVKIQAMLNNCNFFMM